MHHESPVSLYVITEATDKVRLRPLVRILANLVLRRLASGPVKGENYFVADVAAGRVGRGQTASKIEFD